MTSVGIMASAVNLPTGTDVLAENFNSLAAWTQSGTVTTVAGRNGSGANVAAFANASLTYAIPAPSQSDTVLVGFALNPSSWSGGEEHVVEFRSDAAATLHSYLAVRNDRSVYFYGSLGGVGNTAAGVFATGAWNYFEVQVKLHDTAGFATVRLNNTTIISATNVDTKNAGTKTVFDSVRILNAFSGVAFTFDDLYITTGAGAPFKGDHAIP